MNPFIETYLKQSAVFFPIVGREERAYLTRLSQQIEEYFADTPPESLEAVRRAFGPPQQAAHDYLSSTDAHTVARRVRIRNIVRACVLALLGIGVLVCAMIALRYGMAIWAVEQVEGYIPPILYNR